MSDASKYLSLISSLQNFRADTLSLPESESAGLLPVPPGRWCINLYVEGQCHSESGCGMCNISLELLGCLSFHEFCSQP